jgi:hypothetical protein
MRPCGHDENPDDPETADVPEVRSDVEAEDGESDQVPSMLAPRCDRYAAGLTQEEETMATSHVTAVTRRAGRRINDAPGERHNLCGAELTDRDILVADARRMSAAECETWHVCRACLARLR